MNRGTLFSGAVFDLDAGAVTIALPEARGRFISMQVIDEDEYTDEADYKPGGHIFTKLGIGTALPVWLPELTIGDLQVAKNVFDLRFLARRRSYAIRDPEGRSGRRRPKELRHIDRAVV